MQRMVSRAKHNLGHHDTLTQLSKRTGKTVLSMARAGIQKYSHIKNDQFRAIQSSQVPYRPKKVVLFGMCSPITSHYYSLKGGLLVKWPLVSSVKGNCETCKLDV